MVEPTDGGAAEPQHEEDGVAAHRYGGGDVRLSPGLGYGQGVPRSFVTLDELGGDGAWWLDPEAAERLGRQLVDLGAWARRHNAGEDRRYPGS